MPVCVPYTPFWFSICLVTMLATSYIMTRQSRHYYYMDGIKKKFSIFNLEFPANRGSIHEFIIQIRALSTADQNLSFKALRGQLYVDFLFMPATYMGVLLLCRAAACELSGQAQQLFLIVSWFQFLAWSLDITENLILLKQIKRPAIFSVLEFAGYRVLETLKWGFSCIGFISAVIVIIYHAFFIK